MVLGTLTCVLYPFLEPGRLAAAVLYTLVGLSSVVVTVLSVRRHRPQRVAGWYTFAAGQLCWVTGDIVYYVIDLGLHQAPFPSLADAFYLAAYPLYMVALTLITDSRWRRDIAGMLDAAIIATGLGLVYWVFVIGPDTADSSLPRLGEAITIAYPCCDIVVLSVVARMLLGDGRRSLSLRLLTIGTAVLVMTDAFYSYLLTVSQYAGGVFSAGWLLSYVLWSGAALHPSMRDIDRPDADARPSRPGRVRLAVLAACTLLAPAALFVEGALRPSEVSWMVIGLGAVVLFSLVILRTAGFVRQLSRQAGQLEDLAMRDELTGLANRRLFEQRVREALATGTPQVAVLDIVGFKNINDRLGHAAGDRVLAAVAERLVRRLRSGDLVARIGGDEFAVLVGDATGTEGDAIADRLTAVLSRPIVAGEQELLINAYVGVADAAGAGDADELLRRADVALYAAKAGGTGTCRYTAALDARTDERARRGAEIRTALDTSQFRLAYQPIVELPHGRIVSVEALIRWEHPEHGSVSPADFIPVAEQNGLIVELGEWILRTACAQAVTWRDTLGVAAPARMSVNVSARQLAEPGFAGLVAAVLAATGLNPSGLVVEVTETAVFGGGQALQTVNDLHALGVSIALDDFGTGHSSLTLLQTVPVDVLKVDKSFVDNITMAGRHAVIAEALIQVSNGLGLTAVAEGVETADQAAELHRLGYHYAQGYHFGRPVPRPDFGVPKESVRTPVDA
jgi:diguanylate cyclase (GGDEF)-like protein